MAIRSLARTIAIRAHMERPARFALRIARGVRRRLRVVRGGMLALPARLRRRLHDRRVARRFDLILATPPIGAMLIGSGDPDELAVVVCLWNRPERIVKILNIVDEQITSRRLRLVLWNNCPSDSALYRRRIAEFSPTNALASVQLFDSSHNIGGIGRFLAARELVRAGYSGPFIMMDDDQDFGPRFAEDLLTVAAHHAIGGVWAFTNHDSYWTRTEVSDTGSAADHIGTGGSICDSALVEDNAFFERLPTRYLFMEDIWMSHYARRNGWSLAKVESPFSFVLAERDQGHALYDRKEGFFDWLRNPANIPLRPDTNDSRDQG